MFEELDFLKQKDLLNQMINKVGQNVQVTTEVNESTVHYNTKAIITPLRYKNKIYLEGVVGKIGYVDERHYLYIGPASMNFQGMSLNTFVTANGKDYVVKACEPVRLSNEIFYVWAILQTRHQGDSNWRI
jgi:hypothetical protein